MLVKATREAMRRPEAIEISRRSGFEVVAGPPEGLTKRIAIRDPDGEGTGGEGRHQAGVRGKRQFAPLQSASW